MRSMMPKPRLESATVVALPWNEAMHARTKAVSVRQTQGMTRSAVFAPQREVSLSPRTPPTKLLHRPTRKGREVSSTPFKEKPAL